MTIIVGSKNISERVKNVAELSGLSYILYDERTFPNGEVLIHIRDIDLLRGEDIVLIINTYPDTNNQMIKLFQLLEVLNSYEAREINIVMPYLSYSRQDKRFRDGEPISIKMLTEILGHYNVTSLLSFEVHNPDVISEHADFDFINVSISHELVERAIQLLGKEKIFLMAPDDGSWPRTRDTASRLGIESGYIIKVRDIETGKVSMKGAVGDVEKDSTVILFDDEISTGGTIRLAAEYLKDIGIADVVAVAAHLLLVNDADKKILASGVSRIMGSNTIPTKYSILEIEPFIAKYIAD